VCRRLPGTGEGKGKKEGKEAGIWEEGNV
jgi:hypothetical protein